ncbi:hypothetical protein AAU61_05905 [Desulfocarbo indianensis]|nr:hypothetical protein AAU61_05905 [Desulfocarbo indianensis]
MPPFSIKQIRSLPTLPNVMNQIIHTLDDPNSSAADLERIIRNDQAITTKLLAVANSAYYGFQHEITTVRRAAVAVGFNEVRNICLGLTLMGFLHPSTFADRRAAEMLWLHSLAASEAARILALRSRACEPSQAFTAGLLHDIGKVIMAAFVPDKAKSVLDYVSQEGCGYLEAESALEFSHENMGRDLAGFWDLPPVLMQAIGRHHSLEKEMGHLPLVAVIHAADFLARDLALGDSGNGDAPVLSPLALPAMGMDLAALDDCRRELRDLAPKIREQWEGMMQSRRRA